MLSHNLDERNLDWKEDRIYVSKEHRFCKFCLYGTTKHWSDITGMCLLHNIIIKPYDFWCKNFVFCENYIYKHHEENCSCNICNKDYCDAWK